MGVDAACIDIMAKLRAEKEKKLTALLASNSDRLFELEDESRWSGKMNQQ